MFPFVRMIKEFAVHRKAEDLPVNGVHVSQHICWPWDLDIWMELNNGRTLTLYDLGRIPLAKRVGLINVLRKHRWGLTMAGAVVRYRKRVRVFDRFEMRSRAIGWDHRFFYIEQAMYLRGEAASHVVYRSAITGKNGIVPPQMVLDAAGINDVSADLPVWVAQWVAAENARPWPPVIKDEARLQVPYS
jgi:acyl-CoA thioesterase FadM